MDTARQEARTAGGAMSITIRCHECSGTVCTLTVEDGLGIPAEKYAEVAECPAGGIPLPPVWAVVEAVK